VQRWDRHRRIQPLHRRAELIIRLSGLHRGHAQGTRNDRNVVDAVGPDGHGRSHDVVERRGYGQHRTRVGVELGAGVDVDVDDQEEPGRSGRGPRRIST
jgi:hypothetical protein